MLSRLVGFSKMPFDLDKKFHTNLLHSFFATLDLPSTLNEPLNYITKCEECTLTVNEVLDMPFASLALFLSHFLFTFFPKKIAEILNRRANLPLLVMLIEVSKIFINLIETKKLNKII